MPGSSRGKKSWRRRATESLDFMFRRNSLPSPQVPHSDSDWPHATLPQTSQYPQAFAWVPPSTTPHYPSYHPPYHTSYYPPYCPPYHPPNHPPNTNFPIPAQKIPTTIPAASSVPPEAPNNPFLAIAGHRTNPPARGQRIKEMGSTAYAGLTQIVQGLYNCSDIFLPLKTAAGVFLTISKAVDVRIIYVYM